MYDDLVRELRESAEWAENSPDFVVPTIVLHTMRKAADTIEELIRVAEINAHRAMVWAAEAEKAENAHRWIPVTEQPPLKVGDDGYNGYLVYANGYYEVADYAIDEIDNVPYFHVDGEWEPTVTHFMPLPEPPKEETR